MRIADGEQITLGPCDEIAEGAAQVFTVEGREIGVFHRDGSWFAIDNHCPHKGASLAAGQCGETMVSCPWHHWKFDLRTGEAIGRPGVRVVTHAVEERDGLLWVTLSDEAEVIVQEADDRGHESVADRKPEISDAADWADASRCLVRYGAMAWAGYFRFRADQPLECRHGELVLIQTPRGAEVGEILSSLTTDPPRNEGGKVIRPAGELLRRLTPMETFEQARRQRDPRQQAIVQTMLAECERRITERGVAVDVVDGELLFDGETFVLYFLGPPTADLGVLATELGHGRDFKVVFNSVLEAPATSSGSCGSGGCSSGGGCGGSA
jgi:nitrite reductase/ring-hydroxylating ferredoxin subunit